MGAGNTWSLHVITTGGTVSWPPRILQYAEQWHLLEWADWVVKTARSHETVTLVDCGGGDYTLHVVADWGR